MDDEEGIVRVSSVQHGNIGASFILIRHTPFFLSSWKLLLFAPLVAHFQSPMLPVRNGAQRESVPPPEFRGVHAGGGTINRSRKYPRRGARVGGAPRIIAGMRQCPRRIWIPGECSRKLRGWGRVPRDIVTLREPRGVNRVRRYCRYMLEGDTRRVISSRLPPPWCGGGAIMQAR